MKKRLQIRRLPCAFRDEVLQNEAGNAAVEFALVVPVLLYLLLAGGDLGLALWSKAQVANAARTGTEYAFVHGWNSSAITTAATSASTLSIAATATTYCGCATTGGIVQQTCQTSCAAGGVTGTYVSVTAQATYTPISPVHWGSSNVNLSTTEVIRIN